MLYICTTHNVVLNAGSSFIYYRYIWLLCLPFISAQYFLWKRKSFQARENFNNKLFFLANINLEDKDLRRPYLLYADDDLDDQAFLKEMIRRVNPEIELLCFGNGLECFQYLESLDHNAILPSCIVLDLNMPVWDGMQTLKNLQIHPDYRAIPTFIFSTSSSDRDTALAESLGAEAYITKPYGQKELFEVGQEFAEYCNRDLRRKKVKISASSDI